MQEQRTSGVWAAVAIVSLVAALAIYITAYFQRGLVVPIYTSRATIINRMYPTRWEPTIFVPAAKVESLLTRRQVTMTQIPGR